MFFDPKFEGIFVGDQKLFCKKIFGKLILFLVWTGLIAGHWIILFWMYWPQFITWLALSLGAFILI